MALHSVVPGLALQNNQIVTAVIDRAAMAVASPDAAYVLGDDLPFGNEHQARHKHQLIGRFAYEAGTL